MIKKTLLEEFNHQNNLIVISSYPEKGIKYSQKVCAVGGYSKNLINQFTSQRAVIFTTKLTEKNEIYLDKKNLVIRFFKRNSRLSFVNLIYYLLKFDRINKVLIQFEFASFGATLTTAFFIFIPIISKILNKETYFVFHQVVTNTQEIEQYLGWQKKDIRNIVFTPLLRLFYLLISFYSKQIIVLEEEFRQRFINIGINKDKITVIPHGVDNNVKIIPQKTARMKLKLPLNKKIILYFGYLAWYKGADIFINIANNNSQKNYYYVVAGGASFSQKNKPHYKKYLKQFSCIPKNCKITGFVKEKDIPLYFSACDMVVLPYRKMISSSGPLSLAFSYEKPVILSDKLLPYLYSADFQQNLRLTGLSKKDIFYRLNLGKFKQINPSTIAKLIQFSKLMKKSRTYQVITNNYIQLINNQEKSKILEYDTKYGVNLKYS